VPVVEFNRDCPGYAEAARREDEIRALPFLGLDELICGLPAKPLTLRKVQWLSMVKSPFLSKLPAKSLIEKAQIADDVIMFLWIISPQFKPGNKKAQRKFVKTYKHLMDKNALEICEEIVEYVEESFLDSGESTNEGDQRSYYSATALIISFFHANYGMPIDVWENSLWRNLYRKITGQLNVFDVPLKIVFQLIRVHQKNQNPEMILHNRLSQPKLDEWLAGLNNN
jgi:hypothetical protein